MHVLVVSQFYPPEPGATQNRIGTFVEGLAAKGHRITVVCEQPCHPGGRFQAGYGRRPRVVQKNGNVVTERLWVVASPHRSTARRLAFYGSFAAAAAACVTMVPRHDVVFASSPPLPAVLAVAAVARLKGMPLVADVRDIWPAAAAALGEVRSRRILAALERAETWLYQTASLVTTTTRPFCEHVDRLAGRQVSVHLPNGALDELLAVPPGELDDHDSFVVGYAGNLGIAQGLGIVLDAAERLRGEAVRFVLVGDGPEAEDLGRDRLARELDNVEILRPIPVGEVGSFLRGCNALLVPLADNPLLADFIPSKLYDAMAVGRPVILAATGESAALVDATGCGVTIPPEDGHALAASIRILRADPDRAHRLGQAGRRAAAGMARSQQVERLETILLRAVAGGTPAEDTEYQCAAL